MDTLTISDFSGGINEQFSIDNFSNRQWSRLKGFVMDSDQTLRTQWAAQSIGASNAITGGVKSISGFTGSSNSYLVAITNNGEIYTAIAPSDTANYTVANVVSWTLQSSITANTDYRFICEIPLSIEDDANNYIGEVNALLINTTSGSTSPFAIYENDLTNSLAIKTWNRYQPVDQPNLIKPLVGETLNQNDAKTFTATTSWSIVTTFTGVNTAWTIANDGKYPVDVRINTGATITTIQPLDSYTHTSALGSGDQLQVQATGGSSLIRVGVFLGSYALAMRNVMPKANVGCIWKNRLVLGDILVRRNPLVNWVNTKNISNVARTSNTVTITTSADHNFKTGDSATITAVTNTTLNGSFTITVTGATTFTYTKSGSDITSTADTGTAVVNNIQRNPNEFFFSEEVPDSYHEQSILLAGSAESQILGMHVLDNTLVTISSPNTESDGIRVFNGNPTFIDLQEGNDVLDINVTRGGLGPFRDISATGTRTPSCVWPDSGIVVFLDRLGGVWYTDGIQVDRLDRIGPVTPDRTTVNDEISAIGKYLVMRRANRYFVLNLMEGIKGQSAVAAWTELVFPSYEIAPKSFKKVAGSLYFVMDNRVYRFCVARDNQADTERATFDNVQLDCTVGTATLGNSEQHKKVSWFRYGMRTRGRSTAQVRTVTIKAGPNLDTSVFTYTKTINRNLVDRDEFVIPAGIGSSVEISAEATFRGDLQIESATFWSVGMKPSRPGDGSDA